MLPSRPASRPLYWGRCQSESIRAWAGHSREYQPTNSEQTIEKIRQKLLFRLFQKLLDWKCIDTTLQSSRIWTLLLSSATSLLSWSSPTVLPLHWDLSLFLGCSLQEVSKADRSAPSLWLVSWWLVQVGSDQPSDSNAIACAEESTSTSSWRTHEA